MSTLADWPPTPRVVPAELKALRQWVGSDDKRMPRNPRTGRAASSNKPEDWGSYDEAVAAMTRYNLPHIALVVTPPYCVFDLDDVRDPKARVIGQGAMNVITYLDSYTEVSASYRGTHTIAKATIPTADGKTGHKAKHFWEAYNRKVVVFTGEHLAGTPTTIEERQTRVDYLVPLLFPSPPGNNGDEPQQPTDIGGWEAVDHEAARRRAIANLTQWESGRLVGVLDEADAYSGKYPSRSEVDFQAVYLLVKAGLTDAEILAVWRASRLGGRDKVQNREDYVRRAIADARARVTTEAAPGEAAGLEPPKPLAELIENPRQVLEAAGEEVVWVVAGIIARGSITELAGLPKVGKTRWFMEFLRSAPQGTFLGLATQPFRALLLTEENRPTLGEALRRSALVEATNLGIIRKTQVAQPWPDFAALLPALCQAQGFDLVIIDTTISWWGLRPGEENDAAAVMACLEPLKRLAAEGVAVLLVHHLRKTTGEEATAARGSGAFAAGADIVLELRRDEIRHRTRRQLTGYSRFEQTPDSLVIDLTEEGYKALGHKDEIRAEAVAERLWTALHADLHRTREELAELTGLKRGDVSKGLQYLMDEQAVERIGAGVRGDPTQWRKVPDKELQFGGYPNKPIPPVNGIPSADSDEPLEELP